MDIVERLNEMIGKGEYYEPEFIQSKNEIERLRDALRKIVEYPSYKVTSTIIHLKMIAETSLKEKE